MDFQFELGNTLDTTLRKFPDKELCPENIICEEIDGEVATEIFFALYKRNYIKSVEHKEFNNAADIELGDFFSLSVEGKDYIELTHRWNVRFFLRFLLCPSVVSFVTAINAAPIWEFIKEYSTLVYTLLQSQLP